MKKSTFSQLLPYLRRRFGLILLCIALSVGVVAGTLYIPILVGRAIDCIVGADQVDFDGIAGALIPAMVITAIVALLQWLLGALSNRVVSFVVHDLRRDTFAKLHQLPLSYLDRHPQGELVSRMISDVEQLADGLLLGANQLFTGVITILGTLIFMVRIQGKIALVVVFLTPLSLFVARFIASKTHHLFLQQSQLRGQQTAFMDERITHQKVVQAFSQEEQTLAQFDEINDRLEKCAVRATFFSSLTNPSTRFVNALVYAAVAGVGGFYVGSSLSIGGLSTLLSYANQYTKPFNEISGVLTELQNAIACAGRVFDLLNEPPQTPDAAQCRMPKDIRGEVNLSHIDFSYTKDKPLIENFNLSVQPGQQVAIVGPTGCGKTTLINLLMRFYDMDEGLIAIDGVNSQQMPRDGLRRSFGMVLQDTWLRQATVAQNIAMGKPNATMEEIIAAAKAAHCHGFIRRLPEGYNTVLTEDGGNLSQGQRQLLCIARVMLCLPPMLILDEATSSIDTRTELKIQKAFAAMTQGKTCFVVAHRLSTIENADVILVMQDGKIVEQGRHRQLLEQGGFYARLYNSQFKIV